MFQDHGGDLRLNVESVGQFSELTGNTNVGATAAFKLHGVAVVVVEALVVGFKKTTSSYERNSRHHQNNHPRQMVSW